MTSLKINSHLDKILTTKLEEVRLLKINNSLSRFKDSPFYNSTAMNFEKAIKKQDRISLIAEIKKASPSKGIIKKDFDPLLIAAEYLQSDVEAISILTEKKYFLGSINILSALAEKKRAPLLRKDFLFDEIQIHEARANGADAVLLISEILDRNQIIDLTHLARSLKIDVLLELHSISQLDKVDFSINKIIGINNRNLIDFSTNLSTTSKIAAEIDADVTLVSESGIESQKDIEFLKPHNISAILVGEYFMRAENIQDSISQMKKWCGR